MVVVEPSARDIVWDMHSLQLLQMTPVPHWICDTEAFLHRRTPDDRVIVWANNAADALWEQKCVEMTMSEATDKIRTYVHESVKILPTGEFNVSQRKIFPKGIHKIVDVSHTPIKLRSDDGTVKQVCLAACLNETRPNEKDLESAERISSERDDLFVFKNEVERNKWLEAADTLSSTKSSYWMYSRDGQDLLFSNPAAKSRVFATRPSAVTTNSINSSSDAADVGDDTMDVSAQASGTGKAQDTPPLILRHVDPSLWPELKVKMAAAEKGALIHEQDVAMPVGGTNSDAQQQLAAAAAAAAASQGRLSTATVLWVRQRMTLTCGDTWIVHEEDITELKSTQMALAIQQSNGEFIAKLSHDIRTPLNGMLGMLQSLRSMDLPHYAMSSLDVALFSGVSLLQTVNALLDISSSLHQRQLSNNARPRTATEFFFVFQEVCLVFGTMAKEKGIVLRADWDPYVLGCAMIVVDLHRLQQILHNLVSNAIKYSLDGAGLIEVRCSIKHGDTTAGRGDTAAAAADSAGGGGDRGDRDAATDEGIAYVEVTVVDHGIGIEPEQLERVFETYTRVEHLTMASVEGAGLGLSIVAMSTATMRGCLRVKSEPGVGSAFSLQLVCPLQNYSSVNTPDVSKLSISMSSLVSSSRNNRKSHNDSKMSAVILLALPHVSPPFGELFLKRLHGESTVFCVNSCDDAVRCVRDITGDETADGTGGGGSGHRDNYLPPNSCIHLQHIDWRIIVNAPPADDCRVVMASGTDVDGIQESGGSKHQSVTGPPSVDVDVDVAMDCGQSQTRADGRSVHSIVLMVHQSIWEESCGVGMQHQQHQQHQQQRQSPQPQQSSASVSFDFGRFDGHGGGELRSWLGAAETLMDQLEASVTRECRHWNANARGGVSTNALPRITLIPIVSSDVVHAFIPRNGWRRQELPLCLPLLPSQVADVLSQCSPRTRVGVNDAVAATAAVVVNHLDESSATRKETVPVASNVTKRPQAPPLVLSQPKKQQASPETESPSISSSRTGKKRALMPTPTHTPSEMSLSTPKSFGAGGVDTEARVCQHGLWPEPQSALGSTGDAHQSQTAQQSQFVTHASRLATRSRPDASCGSGTSQCEWSGRVLLVEDNVINQKVLRRFLKDSHVVVANNGREAVDIFQSSLLGGDGSSSGNSMAHESACADVSTTHMSSKAAGAGVAGTIEPFDVILMDISMPIMDGVQATRIIRQLEMKYQQQQPQSRGQGQLEGQPIVPRIPIIAITGETLESVRSGIIGDDMMQMCLCKPVLVADLFAALRSCCPRQQQR